MQCGEHGEEAVMPIMYSAIAGDASEVSAAGASDARKSKPKRYRIQRIPDEEVRGTETSGMRMGGTAATASILSHIVQRALKMRVKMRIGRAPLRT